MVQVEPINEQDPQQALSIDENGAMSGDASNVPQDATDASQDATDTPGINARAMNREQRRAVRKLPKKTVVVNGMDLVVDVARLQDDYELMELMAEIEGSGDEENVLLIIKLVKTVMGDQYNDVKEACRVDGRVSTEKMMEVIREVFEAVGELGE